MGKRWRQWANRSRGRLKGRVRRGALSAALARGESWRRARASVIRGGGFALSVPGRRKKGKGEGYRSEAYSLGYFLSDEEGRGPQSNRRPQFWVVRSESLKGVAAGGAQRVPRRGYLDHSGLFLIFPARKDLGDFSYLILTYLFL